MKKKNDKYREYEYQKQILIATCRDQQELERKLRELVRRLRL